VVRIELKTFQNSSLHSVEIPQNLRFINGSAFERISSNVVSIEGGHERFAIENNVLVYTLDHRLIRTFHQRRISKFVRRLKLLEHHVFPIANHFHQFHLNQIHDWF
jgi:cobalamin biosynthesis Co2+ chelatase CbiK